MKYKINEIDWKKVIKDVILVFIPVPIILIGIGMLILDTITQFGNAVDDGIVTSQISNNKLLVFIIMNMGVMFVLFGLLWTKLSLETKSDEEYLLKK